jgi:hypothetical protein
MSIGGYFELELSRGEEYHSDAIRLNTGRNAFEYILRAKKFNKVYLPFYTCDVMLEPITKLNLDYEFYSIDSNFVPIFNYSNVQENEVFVYNNYFGICDEQTREVAAQYKNLIIDNSQAFYSKPIKGVDTFYSPRKFFGLPDGAYLYTNKLIDYNIEKDISYERCEHLLGRMDTTAEQHFQVYKENSKILCNQPIKKMSNLTQRLLSSIDYKTISDKRRKNFNIIHNELGKRNKLEFNISSKEVPMIYPFLVLNGSKLKRELIANKIYVATYWPNVLNWAEKDSFEYNITNNLLALPIDQRYSEDDMYRIIEIIKRII